MQLCSFRMFCYTSLRWVYSVFVDSCCANSEIGVFIFAVHILGLEQYKIKTLTSLITRGFYYHKRPIHQVISFQWNNHSVSVNIAEEGLNLSVLLSADNRRSSAARSQEDKENRGKRETTTGNLLATNHVTANENSLIFSSFNGNV